MYSSSFFIPHSFSFHDQISIISRREHGAFCEYLIRMPVDEGEARTAWVSELRVPPAAIRLYEEDISRRRSLAATHDRRFR